MLSKICNKKNLILLFLILVLFIIIYLKFLSKQKEYFTTSDGEVEASPNSKMEPEATVGNEFSDYREINTDNAEHQYGLRDYYIKTAYNCCNSDGYKNNWVHLCALQNALALGAIGDSFAELNQLNDALDSYISAYNSSDNSFSAPKFLLKAGNIASLLGNKSEALKFYTKIKEDYSKSPESNLIDIQIGKNSIK